MLNDKIKTYGDLFIPEFSEIPENRKQTLLQIAEHIKLKLEKNIDIQLVYICTHNSRRSHFGQIWATVAADYFQLKHVKSFSGGTEATAFHVNAIHALERVGFEIHSDQTSHNPLYKVTFDSTLPPISCYSKLYNCVDNPSSNFIAIMTCGEAEENCPFIPGADLRISTTYEDPKTFDNTPQEDAMYDERCKQIARETFYLFSLIK